MSEEEFRSYVSLYFTTTDNSARLEADNNIQKLLVYKPEQFRNFLDYCINLFIDPKANIQEQIFMPMLIVHALKIKNKKAFKKLQSLWFHDIMLPIHNKIKDALIRGISHCDQRVRNSCAKAIANICTVEDNEKKYISLCSSIYCSLKNPNITLYYFSGLIRTLSEIFSCGILKEIEDNQCLFEFIIIMGNIISNSGFNLQIKVDAAEAVDHLLNNAYSLFKPDIITEFLEIVKNAFPSSDSSLFSTLLNFMKDIIINLHNNLQKESFMKICELVYLAIANSNGNSRSLAIGFWEDIAEFEKNDYQIQYKEKYISYEITTSPFINLFLNIILDIKQNDIEIEDDDPSNGMLPHMVATDTLSILYYFNPELLFNILSEFCDEKINSNNWVNQNAAVLCLLILTNEPLSENVYNFFASKLDTLINLVSQNDIPRLKEISYWTLYQCISKYPDLITNDYYYNLIFDLCEENFNYNEMILKRACQVFMAIFKYSNKTRNDNYNERFLALIFNKINKSDINSLLNLFNALNYYIKYTTEDINDSIIYVLEQMKENISISNKEIKCLICQSLSTIFYRLGKEIMNKYFEYFMNILIGFMHIPELCEDSLICISAIINVCKEDVSFYAENILQFLIQNLTTNNPTLLNISICLIGNIFHYLSKPIKNIVESSVSSINNYIIENKLDKTLIPNVIITLSLAIQHCYKNLTSNTIKMSLNFIDNLPQVDLDIINGTFQRDYIIAVIRAYANVFNGINQNTEFLLTRANIILPFLKQISVKGLYNETILNDVYCLLYEMGKLLNTKINVKLRQAYITKLFKKGQSEEYSFETRNNSLFVQNFVDDL